MFAKTVGRRSFIAGAGTAILFLASPLAPQATSNAVNSGLEKEKAQKEIDKLYKEREKLHEEVTSLRESNGSAWLRAISTVVGWVSGLATALLGYLVWRFGNSVQTKYTETQDLKLRQDRELARDTYYIELFKNLASDNPRLQLAAAAVSVKRLQFLLAGMRPGSSEQSSRTEIELEQKTILEVLLSVLKEAPDADGKKNPLCKFIADHLVEALGLAVAKGQKPSGETSELKRRGLDFQGANLSKCYWARVDARDVDFYAARVEGSLRGGFFNNAVFNEAHLKGAVFIDADLTGARFEKADVRGAKFGGAILTNATFDGAIYNEDTQWPMPPPTTAVFQSKKDESDFLETSV